jgi:hypothetical protein
LVTLCPKEIFTTKAKKAKKEKREGKNEPETSNFQERMVQV